MRWGPRWSQSEGGTLAHAAGASVVPKRRRPPRPCSGRLDGPKAEGPRAHAAGGSVIPKLPSRGSLTLQSEGENQHWPTSVQIGYITRIVWGPQRFRAGTKQQWRTSGRIGYIIRAIRGGPQRFRAGDQIGSGPKMGG